MTNEELFILIKKIKKKHDIALLADLIYLYYNNKLDINIEHIYNSMRDSVVYDLEEKETIISSALKELKDNYNIEIEGK